MKQIKVLSKIPWVDISQQSWELEQYLEYKSINPVIDLELLRELSKKKDQMLLDKEDLDKPLEYRRVYRAIQECYSILGLNIEVKQEELDIEKARSYPIISLCQDYGLQIRNKMILCFIHNDTVPSCRLYEDTNKYHCFACGAHGSVIDMVMNLDNCSFKIAVKKLL